MARLPKPGGDNGNWGDILNEYLSQSHNSDGSLLENTVGVAQIKDESVTANKIAPGAVTKTSVGLDQVDNTSDSNKPVSTATQQVLDTKIAGPNSTVSTALARFSGTSGKTVSSSNTYITDAGHMGINHVSPASPLHLYEYSTATGADGGLTIEQGSTGNALLHFLVTGVQRWQVGTDRSLSDSFTIGRGSGWAWSRDLVISTGGNIGLSTTAPTHNLTFGSASSGIAMYASADQAVNYERLRLFWNSSSNHHTIATENGGTGTNRPLRIIGSSSSLTFSASTIAIEARRDATNLDIMRVTSASIVKSWGIQNALTVDPNVSQSGTAGYTMLLVNPIETTVGSGAKLLADFQVSGGSKVNIDNTGKLTWQGDTNLYRKSAAQIKTDGTLIADGGLFASQGGGSAKIGLSATGILEFGPGDAVRDTFITRTAAGKLNVSNELIVNNKQVLTASGWHFMSNSTPPAGPPVGGGYLFVENGALKYIGSSGTVTTLAPA